MRMSRHAISFLALSGSLAAVPAFSTPAAAQERYAVGADHVAIFNIAGAVHVEGASGGQVTVTVERGGRDAAELRVETGRIGDRNTIRVIYPSDRVVYSARGRGTTNLRVRSDGTWGGDRSSFFGGGTRSVRIAGSGRGTEAHADLRIGVPRGQRVDIYLAVGTITAENVDGTVRLDTHSGGVTARGMSGSLVVDTGSGAVEVAGMRGDLNVDTGSGRVRVSDVVGDRVVIDTGSGRVAAEDVTADRLVIDTGSGGIELLRGTARDARLDTGSGSVTAEFTNDIERLVIDTGSGGVNLALPRSASANLHIDTGSGGINIGLPVQVSSQSRREFRGVLGDGRASIRIDTGSGAVRIREL